MYFQKTAEEENGYLPPEQIPLKVRIQSNQLSIYDMKGVVVNSFMTHEEAQAAVGQTLDFSSIQFKMASYSLQQAQEHEEDLVLLTDQDDVKIGLAARKYIRGKLQILTIHQIALLIAEQLIEQNSQASGKEKLLIRSVNTSEALDYMCAKNEIKCIEVLAGPENLQQAVATYQNDFDIIMAVDEFNHILFPGSDLHKSVNDAFKILLTMAVKLKKQRKTLIDDLIRLYKKYRFYHEKSFCVDGADSQASQNYNATVMSNLRKNLPSKLYNYQVRTINDYKKGVSHNILTGKLMKINLPKTDILQFITVQGDKISIAPSEDYLKLYYNLSMSDSIANKEDFDETRKSLSEKMLTIIQSLGKL